MFRLVILGCLLATSLAFTTFLDNEWESYKVAYDKQYEPDTEGLRRQIWESNIKYIELHNLEADRGLHTYRLGMNKYGDMTNEEFVSVMNGFKQNTSYGICGSYSPPMNVDLSSMPETVDWRTKGYVTDVKDQGRCGSCWSFSTTGSLEGQNYRKTGKLVSLSEKNLMDCSTSEGNRGCKGGWVDRAFAYVIKNKGIDTETSYPYEPKDGQCKFKRQSVGAIEKSCMDIRSGSEDSLKSAVATNGPVSVAIDASHRSFQLYRSGVYNERLCSSTKLDHAVLVVGYGKQMADEYWLVKNSWGTRWGQQGYIMMSRNKRNQCGIATAASFPTM